MGKKLQMKNLKIKNMKQYEIIHLKSEMKSFSWNDGLFAIIKEENGILNMGSVLI